MALLSLLMALCGPLEGSVPCISAAGGDEQGWPRDMIAGIDRGGGSQAPPRPGVFKVRWELIEGVMEDYAWWCGAEMEPGVARRMIATYWLVVLGLILNIALVVYVENEVGLLRLSRAGELDDLLWWNQDPSQGLPMDDLVEPPLLWQHTYAHGAFCCHHVYPPF